MWSWISGRSGSRPREITVRRRRMAHSSWEPSASMIATLPLRDHSSSARKRPAIDFPAPWRERGRIMARIKSEAKVVFPHPASPVRSPRSPHRKNGKRTAGCASVLMSSERGLERAWRLWQRSEVLHAASGSMDTVRGADGGCTAFGTGCCLPRSSPKSMASQRPHHSRSETGDGPPHFAQWGTGDG